LLQLCFNIINLGLQKITIQKSNYQVKVFSPGQILLRSNLKELWQKWIIQLAKQVITYTSTVDKRKRFNWMYEYDNKFIKLIGLAVHHKWYEETRTTMVMGSKKPDNLQLNWLKNKYYHSLANWKFQFSLFICDK
jgi:hypothetical protein